MSKIPYFVEKFTVAEMEDTDNLALKLTDKTLGDAYLLKQIVPLESEGTTKELIAVYAPDRDLIKACIIIEGEYIDYKYLTANEIRLFQEVGYMEVEGATLAIESIVLKWDTDTLDNINAEIILKQAEGGL